MELSHEQFVAAALALPQSERADIAFQLIQSLDPPGEEISGDAFGAELRRRTAAHRRGELESFSLDETRAIVEQRLKQGRTE